MKVVKRTITLMLRATFLSHAFVDKNTLLKEAVTQIVRHRPAESIIRLLVVAGLAAPRQYVRDEEEKMIAKVDLAVERRVKGLLTNGAVYHLDNLERSNRYAIRNTLVHWMSRLVTQPPGKRRLVGCYDVDLFQISLWATIWCFHPCLFLQIKLVFTPLMNF